MGKWQLSMVGVTFFFFLSLNFYLEAKAQFSFYIALVDGVFFAELVPVGALSCESHPRAVQQRCDGSVHVCPGMFVLQRVSPATSPGLCHVMPHVASLPPIFHIVKPLSPFI